MLVSAGPLYSKALTCRPRLHESGDAETAYTVLDFFNQLEFSVMHLVWIHPSTSTDLSRITLK